MASLKEASKQVTQSLQELVDQLQTELDNGEVDFEKLVSISDQISERADGLAETFSSVNDSLMERVEKFKEGGSGSDSGRKQESRPSSKSGSRS
jgi:gas vesicle protein